MRTNRYTFEEVSIQHTHRWVDENGKKRQKTQKFYQTLNPFNKDAEGNIKTRQQIYAELVIERDKWIKEQA